ncbi:UPF0175 family protein [Caldicellulosiruptor sp. F32]|uniref:UPF0175 family protein n=1 Tax=Caldicellulosiruptor sp. F32 TaxID=1214564 RepID=UPI0003A5ACE6|nr:UPF0175 family protein [Caldicellulosiruptor sp. F32]
METSKFEFELPKEIINYLPSDNEEFLKKIKELIVYTLVKEERISFGMAAEILGMNKIDYLADLGALGISYFDQTIEEVIEDKKNLDKLLEDHKSDSSF